MFFSEEMKPSPQNVTVLNFTKCTANVSASSQKWSEDMVLSCCMTMFTPHVVQTTMLPLHEYKYGNLPHPLYSPYPSTTDYHLFRHLDQSLLGREDLAVEDFFPPQTSGFFRHGNQLLTNQWQQCVNADYFDYPGNMVYIFWGLLTPGWTFHSH